MRFLFCLYVYYFFIPSCFSQSEIGRINIAEKGVLSPKAFEKWNFHSKVDVSNDGRYLICTKLKSSREGGEMVVRTVDDSCILKLTVFGGSFFSANSRFVVFMNAPDSLCIINLYSLKFSYISHVTSFWVQGDLLLYRVSMNNSITIFSLVTEGIMSFQAVDRFLLSGDEKSIILVTKLTSGNQRLSIMNFKSKEVTSIYEGNGVKSIIVDSKGRQIAFIIGDSLWLYQKALGLTSFRIQGIPDGYFLGQLRGFSRDGENFFLTLIRRDLSVHKREEEVRIWTPFTKILQYNLSDGLDTKEVLATIAISNGQLFQLQYPGELAYFPGLEKMTDSVCLISREPSIISTYEDSRKMAWDILYTKTGKRKSLEMAKGANFVVISLGGKYVIYYNKILGHFFSYEIATGVVRNVTSGIDATWDKDIDQGAYGYSYICGWLKDDRAFLVYSSDDIWRIDPSGRHKPIRLTNGYGKKHSIKFFLALDEYNRRFLKESERIFLSAFNTSTKENGFYQMVIDKKRDPDSLTMGPYIYSISENPWIPSYFNFYPMRVGNANQYIVRRMSSVEAPNYFITSDFRSFMRLTNMAPQKEFNWYSTILHTWLSLDGTPLQGVLYKPENFDGSKKYPLILSVYEGMSDKLNAYLNPSILAGGGTINIPYYVSNGYLVFCPDIHYNKGDPMGDAYNAIVSAVSYLSLFTYVDSRRIGIQGTSWGAIQTNYLITHTNLFAAACSASGLSNWISGYGSLMPDGTSAQIMYEEGQLRIGATLWEKPEIYIKNSVVLAADRVTSPLLIMHTTDDEVCRLSNILELFTALRRLGKKSWLLQYRGSHTLLGGDVEDFNIRMKQFFDHYLMNKPAPKWMTRSLLFDEDGLEIDNNIETPGSGLNIR